MSTIAAGHTDALHEARNAPVSAFVPALVSDSLTPEDDELERLVALRDDLRAALWDAVDAQRIDARGVPAQYAMILAHIRTAYEDASAMVGEREAGRCATA